MTGTMIRLEGVSKSFGDVRAVRDATLDVGRGELVALLGPSGCGKTTLLRLIAGFEAPDGGSVRIGDEVVAGGAWVPPERRHVGMVFQDYALFPHLTVARNVGYGLARQGRAARVGEALAVVGLGDHADRYPHELSGGQQQRVALARALAPEPAVVLLDEPWSNIDPVLRSSMRDELAGILRATGVTVLLVTHEQEEAFSLADRVALMRDGRIVQAGPPEEIYYLPATRWAAEFVGAANLLPGRLAGGLVDTLVGRFPAPAGNGSGSGNGSASGDADVEVLVRPELLELAVDSSGEGEVVRREFRGHDVFYRVRLPDGTTVCSQRPSNESIPLGARVALRPYAGRVAVFH